MTMEGADLYSEPLGTPDITFCSDYRYQGNQQSQGDDITDCFTNLHSAFDVHQEAILTSSMMSFLMPEMTSNMMSSFTSPMMPALTAVSSPTTSSMTSNMTSFTSSPMSAATTSIMELSMNGAPSWPQMLSQSWEGAATTNDDIEGLSGVDQGHGYQQEVLLFTAVETQHSSLTSGSYLTEPKRTSASTTVASLPEMTLSSLSVTSPRLNTTGGDKELSEGVNVDNLMAMWLNQQPSGSSVKRKRNINPRQRLAANFREKRRMTSVNSAFEELRKTIPILPFEKKLSRIQTLRFAMDYITFMSDILQTPWS